MNVGQTLAELLRFEGTARCYEPGAEAVWDAWHAVHYSYDWLDADTLLLTPSGSNGRGRWVCSSPYGFIASFRDTVFRLFADDDPACRGADFVMRPGAPRTVRLTRIPLYDEGERS